MIQMGALHNLTPPLLGLTVNSTVEGWVKLWKLALGRAPKLRIRQLLHLALVRLGKLLVSFEYQTNPLMNFRTVLQFPSTDLITSFKVLQERAVQ